MAIYHMSVKLISRKAGRSATAAAAYRAAERIEDERTGLVHDYTRKRGVEHTEVLMPHGLEPPGRSALWNAAEAKNKRVNARVAREFEVALPAELNEQERAALARQFAAHVVDRYKVAADVCIHAPHVGGDERNHHAHILTTDNQVNTDGTLGNKVRELDVVARTMAGDRQNAVDELREVWAQMANQALERAGRSDRVDHRSFATRRLEREPTEHEGPVVTNIERAEVRRAARQGRAVVAQTDRRAVNDGIAARNAERAEMARTERRIRLLDKRQKARAFIESHNSRPWVKIEPVEPGTTPRISEKYTRYVLSRLGSEHKRAFGTVALTRWGCVYQFKDGGHLLDRGRRIEISQGDENGFRAAAEMYKVKGWQHVRITAPSVEMARAHALAVLQAGFDPSAIRGRGDQEREGIAQAILADLATRQVSEMNLKSGVRRALELRGGIDDNHHQLYIEKMVNKEIECLRSGPERDPFTCPPSNGRGR